MTAKDKELMRLYGEFLVRFEFICSRLRFAINHLVFEDYDSTKRNICEIITEGLTADPLRKKFIGLVIERYSKKSDIYKVADHFSKEFLPIIDLRNSFAHGTAFFGKTDFIDETKKGKLTLRHPKIKSDGLDLNFKLFSRKKLKDLIANLILLANTIGLLTIFLSRPNLTEQLKTIYLGKIQNTFKLINIQEVLKS